ncbi:MAG: hypothetical protein DRJ42_20410, partial [Deltaproteobacteria bacterium]
PPPCVLRITEVLARNVYRGRPLTPAYEDALARRTPNAPDRDHSLLYLSCDYRVDVNGRLYEHTYNSDSFFERSRPATAECDSEEVKATAIERLRTSTRECTDLRRGEYYGVRLDAVR